MIRDILKANEEQKKRFEDHFLNLKTQVSSLQNQMEPVVDVTTRFSRAEVNIKACATEIQAIGNKFQVQEKAKEVVRNTRLKPQSSGFRHAIQQLESTIAYLEENPEFCSSKHVLNLSSEMLYEAMQKSQQEFQNLVASIPTFTDNDFSSSFQDAATLAEFLQNYQQDTLSLYKKPREEIVQAHGNRKANDPSEPQLDMLRRPSFLQASRMSIHEIPKMVDILKHEREIAEKVFADEQVAFDHFTAAVENSITDLCSGIVDDMKFTNSSIPMPSIDDIARMLELYRITNKHSSELLALVTRPEEDARPSFASRSLRGEVNAMLVFVASVTIQMLHKFREGFASTSMAKTLPKDANVHSTTSNILQFLRSLYQYRQLIDQLLMESTPKDDAKTFDKLFESTLSKLVEFVEAKAQQYNKSRAELSSLFILNNLNFITKQFFETIVKEKMQDLLHTAVHDNIQSLLATAKTAFISSSFSKFAPYFTDPEKELVYTKGTSLLTLESGRQLKERFSNFNSGFEDLYEHHCGYSVPDAELRAELGNIVAEVVGHGFAEFHAKYASIQFSKKNSAKYLKYSPEQVKELLGDLYGGKTKVLTPK